MSRHIKTKHVNDIEYSSISNQRPIDNTNYFDTINTNNTSFFASNNTYENEVNEKSVSDMDEDIIENIKNVLNLFILTIKSKPNVSEALVNEII